MALRILLCSLLLACAPLREPHALRGAFMGTDGASHSLVDPSARFTVVEFFSARCLCQAKHDERLRALARKYHSQGVAFIAVDSEASATLSGDRREAAGRGYSYPILVDSEGRAARALKADYATYSVLFDRTGHVLFRGGIDSDRTHLTDDAIVYLQNALDDAIAQRPVRLADAKTLGCSLALR